MPARAGAESIGFLPTDESTGFWSQQLSLSTDPHLDWERLLAARALRGGSDLTAILALAGSTDTITFSGGFPAPETFPTDLITEVVEELLSTEPSIALQYAPTEGLSSSREAVADFVATTQGSRPRPEDVLVTSGGIEALLLLCHVLVEEGDEVVVEAPSYLGALTAFAGAAATVAGVEMDGEGLVVEDLETKLAGGHRPKLLYVIPDHQNPTGLTMSLERRLALVETCRRYGVLVVEDVAYRELGFDGRPLRSLWSLAPDVVVQIGTFSKILFPGVRLGWAIGPSVVVRAMAAAKQNTDQCAGALGQKIMERLVLGGYFPPHLERARALYERRARLIGEALSKHMPSGVHWTRPTGGFFVWLTTAPGTDTRQLTDRAREVKVAYVPGSPFYADGRGANQLRLSYSAASDASIDEGVGRLARLLDSETEEGP